MNYLSQPTDCNSSGKEKRVPSPPTSWIRICISVETTTVICPNQSASIVAKNNVPCLQVAHQAITNPSLQHLGFAPALHLVSQFAAIIPKGVEKG